METTENVLTTESILTTGSVLPQDPLGLKRFALTESAYDLVTSIKGVYGRLSHAESQRVNPDRALIDNWRNQSRKIGRTYQRLDADDLMAIGEFIDVATTEWCQITKLENERTSPPSHVS